MIQARLRPPIVLASVDELNLFLLSNQPQHDTAPPSSRPGIDQRSPRTCNHCHWLLHPTSPEAACQSPGPATATSFASGPTQPQDRPELWLFADLIHLFEPSACSRKRHRQSVSQSVSAWIHATSHNLSSLIHLLVVLQPTMVVCMHAPMRTCMNGERRCRHVPLLRCTTILLLLS